MSENPFIDLANDDRITDDPSDLGSDELVEVYGRTERMKGLVDSFELSNESASEGTPDSVGGRLRDMWRVLRGRNPATGQDSNDLAQLVETCEEAGDLVAGRAEDFQEELEARIDDGDDIRGFQ